MMAKRLCILVLALVMTLSLAGQNPAHAGGSDDALRRALARVDIFAGLTDAERDTLKAAARLHHGTAGEQVIRQGSVMGRMIVVLDGEADVRIDGTSFVTLSGQVLLGEIEFLDGRPATADVVFLKDADYIILENADLNRIMEDHPRIGYVVIREIAKIEAARLRKTSTK